MFDVFTIYWDINYHYTSREDAEKKIMEIEQECCDHCDPVPIIIDKAVKIDDKVYLVNREIKLTKE